MFNLGELRDRLEIHEVTKKYHNGTGISTNDLQMMCKLRCKKKVQSSKEYLNANKEVESQTVKFLIKTRRDIKLNNIVLYKNEEYNIKNIETYENGWVELVCEVKR
ncbi:MAG: phage head closure protein [Paraclostridium sp.]